jgi:hypothetical protein
MEATPPLPITKRTPDSDAPEPRLLKSSQNKVERISAETRGIFGDFSSWVELRLKLFQVEIQERIQTKVNETIIKVAPVAAGAITGFFGLITLALFLGWWLGHPAWGFLIVTVMLALVTGVLLARKKRMDMDKNAHSDQVKADLSSNGSFDASA